MRTRYVALAVATTAVIGATYVRASSGGDRPAGDGARSNAELEVASQVDRRELDRLIRAYETDAAERPTATGLTFLAQLYVQRGRLTGDAQTYVQATEAVDRAVALAPRDREARTLAAGLRYTTHDFAAAERAARQLVDERPTDQGARTVLGDAQLELGDYTAAASSYGRLGDDAPDAAAVSVRRARLAFLQGRLADADRLAAQAKQQAVASAFGDAGLAYYSVFQGQLDLDRGLYDDAAAQYQQALREAPGYHIAIAGLARARAAQGRTDDAIDLYEQAIAVVPQPDYLAAVGDLYHLTGRDAQAKDAYGTVEVIAELAAINRQIYNRQLALYYADHDVDVDKAVMLTSSELAVRKDVYGYDAQAWALYKDGRYTDAQAASQRALAQGTPDARLWYHAGMIDKALGLTSDARTALRRALTISPAFDPLQAPVAKAALVDLGEQVP
jgi:tetratricopeptide (TPR) repeat protein